MSVYMLNIYDSNHTRKITARIRASPYWYDTPYLYADFFDTVRVLLNIENHTGMVRL